MSGLLLTGLVAGCAVTPPPVSQPASLPSIAAPDCRPDCTDDAEALAETDVRAATQVLEACLSCSSASPSPFLLAADLYETLDQGPKSLQIIRAATDLFPLNAAVWEARSRYELSTGHPRQAIESLQTAQRLRPDDPRLLGALQAMKARHGTPEDRAGSKVAALMVEAEGRWAIDDSEGAVATLREALQQCGQVADLCARVHLRLGLIALASGDLEDALASLVLAATKAEDHILKADVALAQAEVHLARGEYSAARVAAESSVQHRPRDPLGQVNLALAAVYSGEAAAALIALEEAVDLGLARRMSRTDFESLLAPAPWGEHRPQVEVVIAKGWPSYDQSVVQ
ncbi:MAG: hypothetical protein AAFV29_03720 [Myxococcota bacterium]